MSTYIFHQISDLGALLRAPAHTPPLLLEAGEGGSTADIGTRLRYTAPEVLGGQDASLKSDVYAFGMLVFECLTRELPWTSVVTDARALAWAVVHGDRPEVPRGVPRDLVALARACWAHDPFARPTLDQLMADLSSETGVFRGGGGGGGASGGDGIVMVAEPTPDGRRERVSTGGTLVSDARAGGTMATWVAGGGGGGGGNFGGAGHGRTSPSPRRAAARRSWQGRGTPTGEKTASPKTVFAVGVPSRTVSPSPASSVSRRDGSGSTSKSAQDGRRGGGGGGSGGFRDEKGAVGPIDDLTLVGRLHGSPARGAAVAIRRVSSAESSLSTSTIGGAPAEMGSLHMK